MYTFNILLVFCLLAVTALSYPSDPSDRGIETMGFDDDAIADETIRMKRYGGWGNGGFGGGHGFHGGDWGHGGFGGHHGFHGHHGWGR